VHFSLKWPLPAIPVLDATPKVPDMLCELCQQEPATSFHHLIPRTLHSNRWFKKNFTREQMRSGIVVCRQCHRSIHKFASEKELGRRFYTMELLLAHPDVAKYVTWRQRRER